MNKRVTHPEARPREFRSGSLRPLGKAPGQSKVPTGRIVVPTCTDHLPDAARFEVPLIAKGMQFGLRSAPFKGVRGN